MKLETETINDFQSMLLDWYDANGRSFPWRITSDPYKILVSEFLLQKTHVRKVIDVYETVLDKYPDLQCMALADQFELEKTIRPIGFLNRAERLIGVANKVVKEYDSSIPRDFSTLVSFMGIGNYIATAVMVFAFEEKMVVVDTNVIKVLEIELGIISTKSRPRTDKLLWEFAQTLAPNTRIKEFNWALLDYGALCL